jgi:PhnB protein
MASEEVTGPTSNLTPHLVVDGAARAIEFYKKAFGAKEHLRMPASDGKRLMHAHLTIHGASLMLCDDFPEHRGGKKTPPPSAVTLHLQVKNADKAFAKAVDAGAKVVMPLGDMFWGDRYGQVTDPFGHLWSIASPLSKKEAKAAAEAYAAQSQAQAADAKPAKKAGKKK